jgi:hypothetical protein
MGLEEGQGAERGVRGQGVERGVGLVEEFDGRLRYSLPRTLTEVCARVRSPRRSFYLRTLLLLILLALTTV